MVEVRVEIAGLGISLAGADTLRCAMALPGMGVFVAPEGDADLLVALDQPLGLPRCRLLHQFDISDDLSLHVEPGFVGTSKKESWMNAEVNSFSTTGIGINAALTF